MRCSVRACAVFLLRFSFVDSSSPKEMCVSQIFKGDPSIDSGNNLGLCENSLASTSTDSGTFQVLEENVDPPMISSSEEDNFIVPEGEENPLDFNRVDSQTFIDARVCMVRELNVDSSPGYGGAMMFCDDAAADVAFQGISFVNKKVNVTTTTDLCVALEVILYTFQSQGLVMRLISENHQLTLKLKKKEGFSKGERKWVKMILRRAYTSYQACRLKKTSVAQNPIVQQINNVSFVKANVVKDDSNKFYQEMMIWCAIGVFSGLFFVFYLKINN